MKFDSKSHSFGLHLVAIYEAVKGVLALFIGIAIIAFSDAALQDFGERVIGFLHMDPDHRLPRFFLHGIEVISSQNAFMMACLVSGYVILRFAEAYGLWKDRTWAEWLAIISGGLYLPLEFYELHEGFSWPKMLITLGNLALVIYLIWIRFLKATPEGSLVPAQSTRNDRKASKNLS